LLTLSPLDGLEVVSLLRLSTDRADGWQTRDDYGERRHVKRSPAHHHSCPQSAFDKIVCAVRDDRMASAPLQSLELGSFVSTAVSAKAEIGRPSFVAFEQLPRFALRFANQLLRAKILETRIPQEISTSEHRRKKDEHPSRVTC
jgi:hypothetical protein